METKTQEIKDDKLTQKVKELRRENRSLKEELNRIKENLETCNERFNNIVRYNAMLEKALTDLVTFHYKDKIKANFDTFELCIDQKCVKFNDEAEFLTALRILPLIIHN
jgi:predicted nuclease with TOPRIM domain